MNIACYVRDTRAYAEVQRIVERAEFRCERFLSETALVRALPRNSFDLILVDMDDNHTEREGLLTWLNCRSGDNTPVVVLSWLRDPELVGLTLDSGADDFIVFPCEPVELVARLRRLLCRIQSIRGHTPRRSIELAGFSLKRDSQSFCDRGVPIELTPREFTMAWLLFSTPGVYVSRTAMGRAIWGTDADIAGRTIEQHIYKLRKKASLTMERGVIIRTAYTHGYRIELCGPALEAADAVQRASTAAIG